ncbi:MAG: DegV family protein [Monoglobales bacterium]
MKNKLIMDSSCDIKVFEGIDFASTPVKIIAGEKEFIDNDEINTAEMVDFLKDYKSKVTTACPSVGDYAEAFGNADNIYIVTITSALSGSYNAACVAAEQHKQKYPDCKIYVFDSLSAGPEMLLIAEKIRELVSNNLPFEEVVKKTMKYKEKTHLLFSLESLHNIAINGRISLATAKVVGMLGIRFIGKASDEGKLQPVGKARGEKKNIAEIVKNLLSFGYVGKKLRIAHCFNELAAINLKDTVLSIFPSADILIYPTGATCSFYAEKGGLLVGFEGR